MNRKMLFLLATVMIANIGLANALTLDVVKSDIQANANTKDGMPVTVSISVIWETNISSTSQVKSNVRAITEMAVLNEVAKYDSNELKSDTQSIQKNILTYLQNNSPGLAGSSVSVKDVVILNITSRQTPPKQGLQFQEPPFLPLWVYALIAAAIIIGYFLYLENKKDEK